MSRAVRLLAPLAALILLALVPAVVEDSYIRHLFIIAFIYAVIASNWDLSLGYAGLFNFGHLTFFGVGVYTAAIFARTLEIDPWLAILASGFTAAFTALLVAAPIARLKGIYVVLVTFAVSQLAMQVILSQSDVTGGAGGIVRIPGLEIGEYRFVRDYKLAYYYTGLGLLVVSTLFLRAVVSSPFGKSLRAARDNEDYARARGLNVARQRTLALIGSAVFTGIAGGFYAIYLRVASPEVFGFGTLSLALSMVLVGGVGSIWGPILAALALTFATESLASIPELAEARFIFVALAMIVVLRVAPAGLISLFDRLIAQSKPPASQETGGGEPQSSTSLGK